MPAPSSRWPLQSPVAMNAFFGDPDVNNDAAPDVDWQNKNLVPLEPPYPLFYAGKPVKKITVHRLVAPSLLLCLAAIPQVLTQSEIEQYRLDEYGGAFNFRAKRGNPDSLSIHSWGAAIDLSPSINAFRVKYGAVPNMMPMRVVEVFESEGWTWGGPWSNADGMHFQAARIG